MSSFRPGNVRTQLRLVALLLAGVCVPAIASAQQATISGRITAAATGQPIAEARVFLIGTSAAIATNQDGRYSLRTNPGQYEIRVLRVGFQEQKKPVTVTAGGTPTVDFSLAASVVKLTEVVTTATGQQRKVELGNSVTTLGDISQKVEQAPINNLSDLLVAKAPGVVVLPGNMTGSAPSIRIRGIKSVSLSNDPIYVIDGVRMNSSALGLGTGGTSTSMLNVLNPEEIADIEIVKGPSAATLYGTDAANGVIVITTKKGTAGPARWTIHAGTGSVQDRNNYPTQYAIFGHNAAGAVTRCILVTIASGACIADSTTSYNLFADKDVSPITNGFNQNGGAQVNGGTETVRYFVSGDYEKEQGPLAMPQYSQDYLTSTGNKLRDEWVHPEYFRRNSFRTNISAAINPKLDLTINVGYTNTDQRLPQVDNNTFSYLYQGLNNPGFKATASCQVTPTACLGYTNKGGLSELLGGYVQFSPANLFQVYGDSRVDRLISSANATWRPLAWLQTDATIGMDQAQRDVYQLCRFAECPASGTTRAGYAYDTRSEDRNLSGKLLGTARWQAKSNLNLATSVGADYTNTETENTAAGGTGLPPGAQNTGQTAVFGSVSNQLPRASKTLGYYVQEQASFNDRLFLTLAARSDQNSAFGTKFKSILYPKASLSYLLSDEPMFPKYNWLNQFRVRGSYGESGVQPGSITALQTFNASTVNIAPAGATNGTDSPGLIQAALGNPNLKPERSKEKEVGFDTRLFSSRLSLEYTYYNNVTSDALIDVPIAASAGASQLTKTQNYGSIRNTGHEATLTLTLLDRRNFGWDMTIGGSHNTNKVESLGFDANGKPNPTVGTGATRDSVGFPIRGVYVRPFTYSDANNNGIIEASEVIVAKDFVFNGYSVPRDVVTIQNGFDLFNRKLHLSALLDYKGGFSLLNQTTQFYCLNTTTCYDETNKNAPLEDQARSVAQRYVNPTTQSATTTAGFWENGQFWRLREVGATLTVPDGLATRMRARDASLTFTARNLHVWTHYKGTDPESNYQSGNTAVNSVQTDFSTPAPPSYFSVRLNLHY
ncbi:MAG: TonB-dependent outer membrane protein SusC/RagA [Gemmatimonadetes bacterium]|nr:TonB-dependent outer membrane protein SusC/RagA [Gemmatimonadota bacterium]